MSEFKTLANGFQFAEQFVGTAVDENGDVWFKAKDVCDALEITWTGSGNTLRSIPEPWVMVSYYETIKGERETIFINEPAVYKLIFRSNKPKA
ncbi:Bro-N domain-containing protein [Methylomonas sp. EFPC1]|uniref:BRO-N domain-containing protein n=1 Tax=Methylomonas sp. EFPC1 TaxID=2812647 RepID=UPI001967E41A|nr:Bro-N domain-containing protein [Methylomonas sp. EFPC1]QSB01991.1 Bro-N domain-containing protein [Methylomonas sp. EFPC1]